MRKILSIFLYILGGLLLIYLIKYNNFLNPLKELLFIIIISGLIYSGSIIYPFNNKRKIMIYTFIGIFILYLLFLINLTLFDSLFRRQSITTPSFNLIPFNTIMEFINHHYNIYSFIINILGNIIAFMPFAFFLPLLFKRINSLKKISIWLLIIILIIEVTQLLTLTGTFDIDDIILNMGGTIIFYLLLQVEGIKKVITKITFDI